LAASKKPVQSIIYFHQADLIGVQEALHDRRGI
jgi:hypothetical protein